MTFYTIFRSSTLAIISLVKIFPNLIKKFDRTKNISRFSITLRRVADEKSDFMAVLASSGDNLFASVRWVFECRCRLLVDRILALGRKSKLRNDFHYRSEGNSYRIPFGHHSLFLESREFASIVDRREELPQ